MLVRSTPTDLALAYEAARDFEAAARDNVATAQRGLTIAIAARDAAEAELAKFCRGCLTKDDVLAINGVGYAAAGAAVCRFRLVEPTAAILPGDDGEGAAISEAEAATKEEIEAPMREEPTPEIRKRYPRRFAIPEASP